ncbi:protein kinase [Vairimorpha apis BRL 01]|uniref:Protein kinase n=1 Tax=Vairimorpha apis BRL 01 TaxID=1037528 RepID=T0MF63_9MICR|nr:protein kinase [Vairimorpha apis BRL 01]
MKNYKIFKDKYVLIEDLKNTHQPFFKEYTKPPELSLTNAPLCCPFQKGKVFRTNKKNGPKSGFCEVCYVKYNDYNLHVREYEHREFAKDQSNYIKIDEFISNTSFHDYDEIIKYVEFSSSPLQKITRSTMVYDYKNNYDKVLNISRISTGNSEQENQTTNIKKYLNSILKDESE